MTARLAPVKGGFVLISDEDRAVLRHNWALVKKKSSKGGHYAVAWIDGRTAYMHRLIANAQKGQEVDHIDGDGLNNSRDNLRLATRSQNCANRTDYKPKSGFRGVYETPLGRWQAKISKDGVMRRGGNHADPADAARAYDAMAQESFGEFAVLNFPQTEHA